jgi:methyl-accepting chemotaxis protein
MSFISLLIAIVFITFLILSLARVTLKGIYLVRKVIAKSEVNNDLSVQIPVSGNNEITDLSVSFNSLIQHFSQIIIRIIKASANVGIKTNLQSNLIESLVKGVNKQYTEIDLVATAMTEMSATVQEVASNTDHVAHAATQANNEAQTGSQVMTSTIESMNSLSSHIDSAVEVVTKLENESSEISKVLEVITGISEQTNLLALNAAIEAARAGEQGRGFSVVADEVRALALRTKDAADEINNMISALQEQVRKAVQVMEVSKEDAGVSSNQVESAGQAFARIVNEISTINDMVLHIASATKEQNQVTEEMNKSIVNISSESHKTVESGNKTLDATSAISGMIEELRSEASQFKVHDTSLQLVQAKVAHLAWRGRIRNYLDGKSDLSEEQATSHLNCSLGKWYYKEGMQQFGHINGMKDLEKPHIQLHATIKRIIDLKKSNKIDDAEIEYEKINYLSQEVVAVLDTIEQKIVADIE